MNYYKYKMNIKKENYKFKLKLKAHFYFLKLNSLLCHIALKVFKPVSLSVSVLIFSWTVADIHGISPQTTLGAALT